MSDVDGALFCIAYAGLLVLVIAVTLAVMRRNR